MVAGRARSSPGALGAAGFSLQPGSKRQSHTGWVEGGAPEPLELSLGLRMCSKCGKALLWGSLLLLFSFIQFDEYALMGDTKNVAGVHIL